MAKIISVANQKGGAGKTTVTSLMASILDSRGFAVKVIDSDNQRTFSSIRNMEDNPEEGYEVTYINVNSLTDRIEEEEVDFDYIFIDMAGNISDPAILEVLSIVDLIVVCHEPTLQAMQGTSGFMDVLDEAILKPLAKSKDGNPPIVYNLINKYVSNESISKEYSNNRDEMFPGQLWFKHPLPLLTIFKELETKDKYHHTKYNYIFDLVVDELIKITE